MITKTNLYVGRMWIKITICPKYEHICTLRKYTESNLQVHFDFIQYSQWISHCRGSSLKGLYAPLEYKQTSYHVRLCISHTANVLLGEGSEQHPCGKKQSPPVVFPTYMSRVIFQTHTCKHKLACRHWIRVHYGTAQGQPSPLSSASAYISLKESNIPAPVFIYPVWGPWGYIPGPRTGEHLTGVVQGRTTKFPSRLFYFIQFNNVTELFVNGLYLMFDC